MTRPSMALEIHDSLIILRQSHSRKLKFDPIFRRTIEFDRVTVQKIVEQKPCKANNVRQKRKRRVLPAVLQGLMGEANLRFAKGDVDLAAQICMEIIRHVLFFQCITLVYTDTLG